MVVIVIVVGSSSDIISIRSIGQLWDHEVGTLSSWLISLVVLTITLGDTFKSLAETAGLSGIWSAMSRQFNVAAISLLGVYPMARLKSLKALAPVSISGVVGILVLCKKIMIGIAIVNNMFM